MPSTPLVIRPLNDIVATTNTETAVVDLQSFFDDPFTTGLVARFELENASLGDGFTNVVLYDQDAPLSVANFIDYVDSGAYANTIIHRSVPDFIVQGGGFTVDGLADNLATPANAVSTIPTNNPVQNEFSSERSNTRGTLAYAKLGGNPDSATSQWFFNLGDNSGNLDNQNGGFTVFGEVVEEADLNAVDAIAALPTFNRNAEFGQTAFGELPLIFDPPTDTTLSNDQNLIRYRSITIANEDELEFEIVGNTNPTLLDATLDNNQLSLDYLPGQVGASELTIRATNLQGETVEDSFLVTVTEDEAPVLDPEATEPAASSEFIQAGSNGNGPLIDLTSLEAGTAVTVQLASDTASLSDAGFDNLIGLYRVVDETGGIDTDGDGLADVQAGERGYLRAAMANRVDGFAVRAGSNGDAAMNTTIDEFGDVLLDGGAMYAPFMISNAGRWLFQNGFIMTSQTQVGFAAFEELEESASVFNDAAERSLDPVAYYSFIGANPDGAEHVRLQNGNVFGFEDLPANRVTPDNDFNDAAFQLDFVI